MLNITNTNYGKPCTCLKFDIIVTFKVRNTIMAFLDNTRKHVKKSLDFLESGECSNPGYRAIEAPFCNQEPNDNQVCAVKFDPHKVNKFLNYITVPKGLKELFQIIGATDVEFYWDKWTLFSMDQIEARFEVYRKHEQFRVIDFAQAYLGMGHVVVVAFDPADLTIFFRRDGGSNGWDRDCNWNRIKNYTPQKQDTREFSTWIDLVNNKTKIWDIANTMCIS